MEALDTLINSLGHDGLANEVLALLASLGAAFGLCWLGGRQRGATSVWFGRGIVDGLLFPLLALAFTYVAEIALARLQEVALLKVAVPVLISLAGIRFIARVLAVVFPNSGCARLVERLFSWLAWIAAVL